MILDAIFFFVLPRWVFAIWVLVDPQRIELYSRVRYVTCYLIWISVFVTTVTYSMLDLFGKKTLEEEAQEEQSSEVSFAISLASAVAVVLLGLLDLHYSKVISYYASKLEIRNLRKQEDEEEEVKK